MPEPFVAVGQNREHHTGHSAVDYKDHRLVSTFHTSAVGNEFAHDAAAPAFPVRQLRRSHLWFNQRTGLDTIDKVLPAPGDQLGCLLSVRELSEAAVNGGDVRWHKGDVF
jgi:hypothetical protein